MANSLLFLDKDILLPGRTKACSDVPLDQMEKSVAMLAEIIGKDFFTNIICNGTFQGQPTNILVKMLGIFNTTLLGFFLIIFAVVVVMSVLSGAQEGSVSKGGVGTGVMMIRLVMGPMLVVPVHKGLCVIQFLILYIVLIGIQMATNVWKQTIADINIGYTTTLPSSFVNSYREVMKKALVYTATDYIMRSITFQGRLNDMKFKDPFDNFNTMTFTPFLHEMKIANAINQKGMNGYVISIDSPSSDLAYFFCLLSFQDNKQWAANGQFTKDIAGKIKPGKSPAGSNETVDEVFWTSVTSIRDLLYEKPINIKANTDCYNGINTGVVIKTTPIPSLYPVVEDPLSANISISIASGNKTSTILARTDASESYIIWLQLQDHPEFYIAIDQPDSEEKDCITNIDKNLARNLNEGESAEDTFAFNMCNGKATVQSDPNKIGQDAGPIFDLNYGGDRTTKTGGEWIEDCYKVSFDKDGDSSSTELTPDIPGCVELYMLNIGNAKSIGGYNIQSVLNVGGPSCDTSNVTCDITPLIMKLVNDLIAQADGGYQKDGSDGFCPTISNVIASSDGTAVKTQTFGGVYLRGTGPNPDLGCYKKDPEKSGQFEKDSTGNYIPMDFWPKDPAMIITSSCTDAQKGINCIKPEDCKEENTYCKINEGVRFDNSWWYAGQSYFTIQRMLKASYNRLVKKANSININNAGEAFDPLVRTGGEVSAATMVIIAKIVPGKDNAFEFKHTDKIEISDPTDSVRIPPMASLVVPISNWEQYLNRLYLNGCKDSPTSECSNFQFSPEAPQGMKTTYTPKWEDFYAQLIFGQETFDDNMEFSYPYFLLNLKQLAVASLCGNLNLTIEIPTNAIFASTKDRQYNFIKPQKDLDSCKGYSQLLGIDDEVIQKPIMALIDYIDKIDPSGPSSNDANTINYNLPGAESPLMYRKKQVNKLTELLVANGYIQSDSPQVQQGSVSGVEEMSSARYLINGVFSGVFGGASGSSYNATTGSFGDILTEIYNVGLIVDKGDDGASDGAIADGLNMIGNLQQSGKNMIQVVMIGVNQTTKYLLAKGDMSTPIKDFLGSHDLGVFGKFDADSLGFTIWGGGDAGPGSYTISEIRDNLQHNNKVLVGWLTGVLAAVGSIPMLGGLAPALSTIIQLMMSTVALDLAFSMMYLPLVIFLFTSLFTAGISFAIIVPLTPFILYWAGQVAWLLVVIEALIAAPIIALGIAVPGGQQHIGHVVPGVKMLISLIFRPVLMVLGLVTGLLLTYILVSWSSEAFHLVARNLIGDSTIMADHANNTVGAGSDGSLIDGILACMLIMVYTTFIAMAFTECFSPIYKFPEKIMQYIGGQADKAGEQQLQQISSATQQQATQAAGAGGQAMQGSSQAATSGIQMASGAQGGRVNWEEKPKPKPQGGGALSDGGASSGGASPE